MRPMKRAVHIDFHTMPGIDNFNESWDAAAFAQRLADAHVGYINMFAKCNIGFCYYPSKIGPVYPGMKGDMFGDLLRECHKRDIGVTAYFNAAIDQESCRVHADWCRVQRNPVPNTDAQEMVIGTAMDTETSPWIKRLTCFNTGFGDYLKDMLKEFLSMYPEVDGVFFDCINDRPCYCNDCLQEILTQGGDPLDVETVRLHTLQTNRRYCLELKEIIGDRYMLCNSQPYWRTKDYNTHIEIECLQNGGWTYEFFSPQVAYARNIKKDVLYMNGRFHKGWGDFGGLKNKAALENDMYDAIRNGIGCSIGDHMHPAEILDEKVCSMIGEIYSQIEKLEPWTEGAVYQADIGILCSAAEEKHHVRDSYSGLCRMLDELKYTYDILNETMDMSRYKLLILPDDLRVGPEMAAKLETYLKAGGKVLSSGFAGMAEDKDEFALPQFWPMQCTGKADHENSFYQLSEGDSFRYAMYAPTIQTDLPANSQVLAWQVAPQFEKTWDGVYAYIYNPPKKRAGIPAAMKVGSVCHIHFQVFDAYRKYLYPAHKELVQSCIRQLLPNPSFTCTDIPSTARVTLTAKGDQKMVHIKVTYPELRGSFGIIEEHAYLPAGATVTLEGTFQKVYTAPDRQSLPFTCENGKTTITLPQICGYLLIAAE